MRRGLRQTINEWMVRRAFESERETRRRAAEDPAFRAHLERFEADERPVLDALADAGLRVKELGHLTNREIDYTAQIPVLIEWLPRAEYAPVKATIAGALTVREQLAPDCVWAETITRLCCLRSDQHLDRARAVRRDR
jgi:hypothetical protein